MTRQLSSFINFVPIFPNFQHSEIDQKARSAIPQPSAVCMCRDCIGRPGEVCRDEPFCCKTCTRLLLSHLRVKHVQVLVETGALRHYHRLNYKLATRLQRPVSFQTGAVGFDDWILEDHSVSSVFTRLGN